MGGPGSTRWKGFPKKRLVEDCLVLDLVQLKSQGLFKHHQASGVIEWTERLTGGVLSAALFSLKPIGQGHRGLALAYRLRGGDREDDVAEAFILEPRRPHFGGVRWFARCPGLESEQPCNRRVLKLYLPSGARTYRCRDCYSLTYLSAQDHDIRVDQLKRDQSLLSDFLDRASSLSQGLLATKTLPRWLQPFPKRPYPSPYDAQLVVSNVHTG